jgi:hypothetical protein
MTNLLNETKFHLSFPVLASQFNHVANIAQKLAKGGNISGYFMATIQFGVISNNHMPDHFNQQQPVDWQNILHDMTTIRFRLIHNDHFVP